MEKYEQNSPGCNANQNINTEMSDVEVKPGISMSIYSIPKMDCPSEERLIKLALSDLAQVHGLVFDLSLRQLKVVHEGPNDPISAKLNGLNLGATLQETLPADPELIKDGNDKASAQESITLYWLLGINAILFLVEFFSGLVAQSTGLIGESLDNFADAAVYGLALYAIGHGAKMQLRAAHVAGLLQLAMAFGLISEVVRRFIFGSEPESMLMMLVAFIALLANTSCLLLISRHRESGAHMKASWIFSANDVLINMGVITAGVLVMWTGLNYPDLIIGSIAGVLVLYGAKRILSIRI